MTNSNSKLDCVILKLLNVFTLNIPSKKFTLYLVGTEVIQVAPAASHKMLRIEASQFSLNCEQLGMQFNRKFSVHY